MTPRTAIFPLLLLLSASAVTRGDGPKDNIATDVRRIPPPGITVSAEDRKALETGLADLESRLEKLQTSKDPKVIALIPDVRIFSKAVHDALTYQEFLVSRRFLSFNPDKFGIVCEIPQDQRMVRHAEMLFISEMLHEKTGTRKLNRSPSLDDSGLLPAAWFDLRRGLQALRRRGFCLQGHEC